MRLLFLVLITASTGKGRKGRVQLFSAFRLVIQLQLIGVERKKKQLEQSSCFYHAWLFNLREQTFPGENNRHSGINNTLEILNPYLRFYELW